MVDIAQLVSVPGCGPGGRGFESHYSPHFNYNRSIRGLHSSKSTLPSDSNGQTIKQSCELFDCPGVIVQTFRRRADTKMCACVVRDCLQRSNGANPTIHPTSTTIAPYRGLHSLKSTIWLISTDDCKNLFTIVEKVQ